MTTQRQRQRPPEPARNTVHGHYQRLQAGDYRPEILDIARSLAKDRRPSSRGAGDVDALTAANFIAEVFDYHGLYGEARSVLARYGPDLKAEIEAILSEPRGAPDQRQAEQRRLWRAKICGLLNYAHTFYRDEEYETALRLLLLARRGLDRLDGGQPGSYGTRWRLLYRIGQTYRQLNRFASAEEHFTEAIEFAWRRLEFVIPHQADASEAASTYDFKVAQWAAAKVLVLGLGWLYFAQGQPEKARPLVTAGRVLLHGSQDWVHSAYAQLLDGCIKRTQAGPDSAELAEVIDILNDVRAQFTATRSRPGHATYKARASYELAHAYYWSGDTKQASDSVEEVIAFALKSGARRWLSLALTLRSRIERTSSNPKERGRALETAMQALRHADLAQQDHCRVEALIACGEAEYANAERQDVADPVAAGALSRAKRHLEEAYTLAADNPKTRAACCLHLARVDASAGNMVDAERQWNTWRTEYESQVKSGWVHQFADTVRHELQGSSTLAIDSRGDLDYELWRRRLQAFLLSRAEAQSQGNLKKTAELLKVSRQTVYGWKRPDTK